MPGQDGRSFAQLLRGQQWQVGTVLSSPDLLLAERIAQEFDYVWIDLEHSALSISDAQGLAIATRAGGAAALVRVPRSDSELLGSVLDAGVDGVVAPKVESESQAAQFVDAMRYPPAGSRGFAPRRATGGQAGASAAVPPAHVACIVQIETRAALERVEAIARTDGVDALVIGTADLSFDLGFPLDVGSEPLVAAIRRVGEAATKSGCAWGVAVGEVTEWLPEMQAAGASTLLYSSDTRIYAEAVKRTVHRLRIASQAPSRAAAVRVKLDSQ